MSYTNELNHELLLATAERLKISLDPLAIELLKRLVKSIDGKRIEDLKGGISSSFRPFQTRLRQALNEEELSGEAREFAKKFLGSLFSNRKKFVSMRRQNRAKKDKEERSLREATQRIPFTIDKKGQYKLNI